MNTRARDRVANLDFWSSPVEPQPLGGGITNINSVVDDQGRAFCRPGWRRHSGSRCHAI